MLLLVLGTVGTLVLGYCLGQWTDQALPYWDSGITAFNLVATGQRWNRGRLLSPFDNAGPGAFGIAFTLAADTPADRVAPAYFGAYGWGR